MDKEATRIRHRGRKSKWKRRRGGQEEVRKLIGGHWGTKDCKGDVKIRI